LAFADRLAMHHGCVPCNTHPLGTSAGGKRLRPTYQHSTGATFQGFQLSLEHVVHRNQRTRVGLQPSDVRPCVMKLVNEHQALVLVTLKLGGYAEFKERIIWEVR
jgi:hypothetical protein